MSRHWVPRCRSAWQCVAVPAVPRLLFSRTSAERQDAGKRRSMDRWGCIRFPELPLQVALLRREDREHPFAVVRDERPSSPLLFVNPTARQQGLRPGMRYTAALSVIPQLQVGMVTEDDLAQVRTSIV